MIEQLVLEPLTNNSDAFINNQPRVSGREITSKRRKAKRARNREFEAIAAQNESIYDAEMAKRVRSGASQEDIVGMPAQMPQTPPSYSMDGDWNEEDKDTPDSFAFTRDPFVEDLEQLLREGEPIIPESCWACRVVNDNSPYAVFKSVWAEFMGAVEDLMSTGATIKDMGIQLYTLFHKHIVVKVRDISNGQCEVTGNFDDEEIWSAYSIMHHFLVHSVTPERLQWVLIKRYQGLMNIQFRGGVVKYHKQSGRRLVDQKGLDSINNIVETLKKVYSWDTKKMCYSNNKKNNSSMSPQTGIYSGKIRYNDNSIRRVSGGKNKPW